MASFNLRRFSFENNVLASAFLQFMQTRAFRKPAPLNPTPLVAGEGVPDPPPRAPPPILFCDPLTSKSMKSMLLALRGPGARAADVKINEIYAFSPPGPGGARPQTSKSRKSMGPGDARPLTSKSMKSMLLKPPGPGGACPLTSKSINLCF